MRKTKIICTLGPVSEKPEILKELIKNGANVIRLNFSHGDYDEHKRRIELIKEFRKELSVPIAILLDTKGPEIRLGKFKTGQVFLKEGQHFTLTVDDEPGDQSKVSISYKGIVNDVCKGSIILIDDGLIALNVEKVSQNGVKCTVINGGVVSDRKGVNIPGIPINLPPITDRDIADIKFGIENGIDYIAASFVQRQSDIMEIRKILKENNGGDIGIIAKIENQHGLDNIDEIIEASDGVMIARGDLGVEIPTEEVPVVQKDIIKKCRAACKPVITATQMLDSMIRNPRPTRAEASDVANAIYDGTDAIMLSGETAAGKYPIEALCTMVRIVERVESSTNYVNNLRKCPTDAISTTTHAISHASCAIADDLDAAAIITPTKSGYTARMVSKYRPQHPIIATTTSESVYRKLALIWGVIPYMSPIMNSTDEMIEKSVQIASETGFIKKDDLVVITAGIPVGVSGNTNLIKVHVL